MWFMAWKIEREEKRKEIWKVVKSVFVTAGWHENEIKKEKKKERMKGMISDVFCCKL